MNSIFRKTLGGLSAAYYVRHFIFSLIFPAIVILGFYFGEQEDEGILAILYMTGYLLLNSLLYPYSRFVYESIVEFILGENFLLINGGIFFVFKCISMIACYMGALFIAPLGLIYLYYYHSKNEK